jgi:opacity protein-like surface antigen
MTKTIKAGIALAALTGAVAMAGSATAADLGMPRGGSIKDNPYMAPMPVVSRGAGNCYGRADVGYAASGDPEISWAQTVPVGGTGPNGEGPGEHVTDDVATLSFDNTWFGAIGGGCGWGGSRGIRAEVMLGYHGSRKIDGEPAFPWFDPDGAGPLPPEDDPLHTDISSYSFMLNLYKDLGTHAGFTPYLGAGIGAAYNMMDDVYFTGNPALINQIRGDEDLAFAWSLMAGVGYQLSERAILDVGYRYLNLGSVESGTVDSAGFFNPAVNVDDIDSHEIKVGLRYHFGQSDCCSTGEYVPMK